MALILPMKRMSLRKSAAPSPRLTLWVPGIAALCLCLIWLGLLALFHR